MLTLLPGEPSASSTLGILSPSLTKAGEDWWNMRRAEAPTIGVEGRRRRANMMIKGFEMLGISRDAGDQTGNGGSRDIISELWFGEID